MGRGTLAGVVPAAAAGGVGGAGVADRITVWTAADAIGSIAGLTAAEDGGTPNLLTVSIGDDASIDSVYVKLGDSTSTAGIVDNQRLLDFGSGATGNIGTSTGGLRIRLHGTGNIGAATIGIGINAAQDVYLNVTTNFNIHHAGQDDPTFQFNNGSLAMLDDSVTQRGQALISITNGVYEMHERGTFNVNRFTVDCNHDTANIGDNGLVISRVVRSGDDTWEVRAIGNAVGNVTNLDILTVGELRLSPGGTGNDFTTKPMTIIPGFPISQTGGGNLIQVVSPIGGSAFVFDLDGADAGDYAVFDWTFPFRVSAAGAQLYGWRLQMTESVASANTPILISLEPTPFGGSQTTVFRVDFIGDVLAGNYTGLTDQALIVSAGVSTGTSAGQSITVQAGDGIGLNQDGGTVLIRAGLPTGAGAVGTITIGRATEEIAFFAGTPSVRRADYGAVTDSTTGTAGGALNDAGPVYSQGTLNDNFAQVAATLADIRANWQAYNLMA